MKHLNPEEELKEQADDVTQKSEEKSSAFTLNTGKASIDSAIDDLFNI
jgi:hypothetical protein